MLNLFNNLVLDVEAWIRYFEVFNGIYGNISLNRAYSVTLSKCFRKFVIKPDGNKPFAYLRR